MYSARAAAPVLLEMSCDLKSSYIYYTRVGVVVVGKRSCENIS